MNTSTDYVIEKLKKINLPIPRKIEFKHQIIEINNQLDEIEDSIKRYREHLNKYSKNIQQ